VFVYFYFNPAFGLQLSLIKLSVESKVDVLCIQEHWLSETQLPFLGDISDKFSYTGVSGFDSSVVLHGRLYGGCGIL